MAMATLQSHNLLSSSSTNVPRLRIHATLDRCFRKSETRRIPLPSLSITTMDELTLTKGHTNNLTNKEDANADLVAKLYAIAETASDRAEMHEIIGKQRDNWGHLLLNSVNAMTLTASMMAGISAFPDAGGAAGAFKVSSAMLYGGAVAIMMATNKIQPSQLAEEQRNAARLFRKLEKSIHTTLALRSSLSLSDVNKAADSVLALDKAYPLSLSEMIEKFPKIVKPTKWWSRNHSVQSGRNHSVQSGSKNFSNGWSKEIEEEMKGALRVLKTKDVENYLTLGRLVLPINKAMSISGPLLAGLAAVAASSIGTPILGELPVMVAMVGGVMAATVNALEHGGQIGMVFELARNCAGNYLKLQEEIEENLERDVERRENGELFEMKMAMELGRSISEMRDLSKYASSSIKDEDIQEYAGKLY